jgi:hypothetical protein
LQKNPIIFFKGCGIGDDTHSYGYDGSRETLFPSRKYGKQWTVGSIVGVMIDLDSQEIAYSQNGEHFGIAFSNFREKDENGKFLPYKAGISIDQSSRVTINFGASDFRFFFSS